MRIDPKAKVGGYPTLVVRKLVRRLNSRLTWDLETVQRMLSVGPGEARGLVKALEAAGLAKGNRGRGPRTWTTTQLAQSFGSATAATAITRQTAAAALARFLERVDRVNSDDYFLAQVTRVILFGSYLRAEVNRLGDVDVAVELQPKEADRSRLRELNYRRAAEWERNGHRFSRVLDRESWWQMETFRFLKDRSRSISLVDYQTEKAFVDQVPHRILFSKREEGAKPPLQPPTPIRRARRPKDCPF
jgi:predicted nucleotidyltransferase